MKIILKNSKIILSFFIFLNSCEEPNKSDSIWDDNDVGSSIPVISTVIPSQNAFAGIDTVLISGSNFSENMTENHVYFNGIPGTILRSTASSILVITPNLVSDSIKITVSVQGAFIFGEYENKDKIRKS